MNLGDFANVGELVAATATVITLVFVAFELRANRRQNRLAILMSLDKGWNDINAQMAADEVLGSLMIKGMRDPDSLTDQEAARFWWAVIQYINHHKSVWALLAKEGLDTHHDQWMRSDISACYNTPGWEKVFRSMSAWTLPEFIAFVDKQREMKIEFPDWREVHT